MARAWRGEWVALASFSAAALKCQARDAWIGWTLRHKYDRLHLVANNTRFLLLRPVPNLGSRVLGLCARHLVRDWPARFHHPLVLLETFVDPSRFVGTVYRAAGWTELGMTRGFRRVRGGYRAGSTPKKVFVRALTRASFAVSCARWRFAASGSRPSSRRHRLANAALRASASVTRGQAPRPIRTRRLFPVGCVRHHELLHPALRPGRSDVQVQSVRAESVEELAPVLRVAGGGGAHPDLGQSRTCRLGHVASSA